MRRDDLAWLLGMANDMRARHKDQILSDLPISVPEDSGSCIIATAFNYGCEVSPCQNIEKSYISFSTREDAETYCAVMNVDPKTIWSEANSLTSGTQYKVQLTPDLNDVAIAFDEGEYEEYSYWVWAEGQPEEEATV